MKNVVLYAITFAALHCNIIKVLCVALLQVLVILKLKQAIFRLKNV